MSDLQKMLRESLAARAGQLDEPTQYAASPALVSDVAARVAQLNRRRTVARVGGAAAGVLVIAVVGGCVRAWPVDRRAAAARRARVLDRGAGF